MRYITTLLLTVAILCYSGFAWSANCEYCYEKISKDERFCEECSLKFSRNLSGMKFREEKLVNTLNYSREDYENALKELIQFYLDIGYQLRLEKARKELKALNKVPQFKYLETEDKVSNVISPNKNIDEANMLFQDGKMHKNSLNLLNKKAELVSAITRFEKIMNDYPESDKVDDAAYELADIYEGAYFRDY